MGIYAENLYRSAKGAQGQEPTMLIIWGGNGCGKTHAAMKLFNWFSKAGTLQSIRIMSFPLCIQTYNETKSTVTFTDAYDDFFLVIDDVGAERNQFGGSVDILYNLLNARINSRKWTVITTNLAPESWVEGRH